MKNKLIFIIILFLFIFPFCVSAYTLLEPLPTGGGDITEVGSLVGQTGAGISFSDYLSWFFRFALAAAAFLAVLQITIAGIQWIAGGASESVISNAKGRISDAVWGILLILGSWLILFTINPNLASMKLDIPKIKPVVLVPVPVTGWICTVDKSAGIGFECSADSTKFRLGGDPVETKAACETSCEFWTTGHPSRECILISACEGEPEPTPTLPEDGEPEPLPPSTPFSVDPTFHDFGELPALTSSKKVIELVVNEDIFITSVSNINPKYFFIEFDSCTGNELISGSSCSFTVTFVAGKTPGEIFNDMITVKTEEEGDEEIVLIGRTKGE